MTLITQFTEHEELSQTRFLDQFRNSVDLKAYMKGLATQIQDLENAAFEVILERVLPTAVGEQLNALGAIVGQPRTTSDDAVYQVQIQARIAINLSDSTPEDLINVGLLIFLSTGETFFIREEWPAQTRVTVIDPIVVDPALAAALLESTDPAGSRLLFSYSPSPTSSRLRFTSTTTPNTPSGQRGAGSAAGFGDSLGGHTGGLLVSVTEG
jgi:hypothetical protein